MLTAIFFDLDGTIADSEPQHWNAWRQTLEPLSVDLAWDTYVKEAIGHSDEEILFYFAGHLRHSIDLQNVLARKRDAYVSIVKKSCPIHDDTIALLNALQSPRKALVTSSTRAEASAVLASAGLSHAFQTLVCIDDVVNAKPDPEPYIIAKTRLGVTTGLAFEDSTAGLNSANAAGLFAVEVQHPRLLPKLVHEHLSRSSARYNSGPAVYGSIK